jgi:putative transposon-encoded protein
LNRKVFKYILIYIIVVFMRKIELIKSKLKLIDEITVLFEKSVTRFGTGAKIDCPKEYIGKKVYVMVRKQSS